MKNSKKIASVLMATALLAAAGISASAETVPSNPSHDVMGTYTDSSTAKTVYSVDVKWGAMKFNYTKSGNAVWNPEDHSYDRDGVTGTWNAEGNTVTVTNHSNAAVKADAAFAAETGVLGNSVTGTFATPSTTLDAGKEGNYAGADKEVFTLTLNGDPTDNFGGEETKIGTVTIDLSAAE